MLWCINTFLLPIVCGSGPQSTLIPHEKENILKLVLIVRRNYFYLLWTIFSHEFIHRWCIHSVRMECVWDQLGIKYSADAQHNEEICHPEQQCGSLAQRNTRTTTKDHTMYTLKQFLSCRNRTFSCVETSSMFPSALCLHHEVTMSAGNDSLHSGKV